MNLLNEIPLKQLAARAPDAHKGDFGRAVLIGGSLGMSGAISLAGAAALRSGAGLVTLAIPETVVAPVAAYEPSYMTWPLPADNFGRIGPKAWEALQSLSERATCLAIGPGLNRSSGADELVLKIYADSPLPMVVDADALNVLAERGVPRAAGPRILTPHPGEFRRLCPRADGERAEMERSAHQWAEDHGIILVLKGCNTLVTDGRRRAHNMTGNPGLATGGVGDILTGVITGLLAQSVAPADAARLGVFVHGLAGDLACAELGEIALIASDLLRYLPRAFREVAAQKEEVT